MHLGGYSFTCVLQSVSVCCCVSCPLQRCSPCFDKGITMATGRENDDGSVNTFDHRRALRLVQTCVLENGDVSLPIFVDALEELFNLAARGFRRQNNDFMMSAFNQGWTVLRELCSGQNMEHYSTVQSMVDYEIQHQLVERQDKPSGTVTLIRIQRTIEFFCAALNKFNDNTITRDILPSAIVEAYTQTLARYHPQLMVVTIQMGLTNAVLSTEALLDSISGISRAESRQWFLSAEQYLRKIIDSIQKVYADRGLLSLPQGSL